MIKRSIAQLANMLGIKWQGNTETMVTGVTIDSRKIEKGNLFVPFKGEHTDGHVYVEQALKNGAAVALWQKDVPNPPDNAELLIVDDTLEALQKIASSYLQEVKPKVIGITGSNGKTTTKDITEALLSTKYKVHKTSGNFNNHLGLPLTILGMDEDTEIAVLEMGMSSRGEIELLSKLAKPDVAIITNIGESHLLDLGSREEIAAAKLEIMAGLKEDGMLIFHGDEPLLKDKLMNKGHRMESFGRDHSNTIHPLEIQMHESKTVFLTNLYPEKLTLPILGNHNVMNAMAAILTAKEFGVDFDSIQQGLLNLKVTNMRMELINGNNGVKVINDAYNASPTSMNAAIQLVSELKGFNHKYLVLGDMLELGKDEVAFHQEIGAAIPVNQIAGLFTYGELGEQIAEGAKTVLNAEQIFSFKEKEQLIDKLKEMVSENDLVLVKASRGMRLEEVVNSLV